MFDFFFTLVLVYVVYRGYAWYYRLQEQMKASQQKPPIAHEKPRQEQDDYVDYEEVE